MDLFEYDKALGINLLCGVDEAGRGPLAGDVYAAAVILPKNCVIEGLNDSKKISQKKREKLFEEITQKAVAYSIGIATVEEIDETNILQATFLAMKRAVDGLKIKPDYVLIDGDKNPDVGIHSSSLVKGDATSACVAAASIIAKVSRDRYMEKLSEEYPQYQFEKHKGYGTKLHTELIVKHGISPIHRKSFLKKLIEKEPNIAAYNGKIGEEFAVKKLKSMGIKVIETNYRGEYGEIDIIAQQKNQIKFIEVKTRTANSVSLPKESVTSKKQEKIKLTAQKYIKEKATELQPCFDVAEIFLDKDNKPTRFEYYENAF